MLAALPVILGAQHRVFRLREVECAATRFESDVGSFTLQLFLGVGPVV